MNEFWFYFIYFGLPLIIVWLIYGIKQARKHRRAVQKLKSAKDNGMGEPVSLHPTVDPNLCLGCGACVKACPEGEILGLISRKAVLVEPTACIGHGACLKACPTQAITLVFGSETRGVEIPTLSSDFETNIPGAYIAGELGGMGLIRNAISQGQQAANAIAKSLKQNKSTQDGYDLAIVGAGAAGLAASLAAKEKGLKTITLEQDTIGGTISHYPRGKVVMTQPAVLPLVGKFQFREASKEELVAYWDATLKKVKLNIKTGIRVDSIVPSDTGFQIYTNNGELKAQRILLAMGRRGTPRKLGIPGEELSKVVYRLIDAEQYKGNHVLVVGGGDSALEAAIAIAEQPKTTVTIAYRSAAFSRAKGKNKDKVAALDKANKLRVMMESSPLEITPTHVKIQQRGQDEELRNDFVIVCAGGILPTPFLKKIGINVEEKFGTQ